MRNFEGLDLLKKKGSALGPEPIAGLQFSREDIYVKKNISILLLLSLFLAMSLPSMAQSSPDESPDMAKGLKAFYAGDWDQSIQYFTEVVNQNPKDTLALAYILDAYYRKQDVDTIVNKIEVETAASGEDPEMRAHLGMAFFLRGKILPNVLDESLEEFRSVLKDDDKNSMAYTGTGLVYFQKRMMPRAKGYFVRALRLNPHDVMAMDRLGNILLVDEKKPNEAKDIFERVIQELPNYPDGYYFLGSSLFDMKQYDRALPYLEKCAQMDPNGYTQGFDAMTLQGDTLLILNRKEEALQVFEAAQKVRPDSKYVEYKIQQAKDPNSKPGVPEKTQE